MENVYSSIHGEDFLNSFLKLHKLKINTLEYGLCVSSYEKSVPKLLSSEKGGVVKDDDLYLDTLKTWDDFDRIETGLHGVWKTELEDFSTTHQTQINDRLGSGSPASTLATMSFR